MSEVLGGDRFLVNLFEKIKSTDLSTSAFESKIEEMPMAVNKYEKHDSVTALAAIRSKVGIAGNVRPTLAKHLTYTEGTSNKYHYFALFQVGDEFIAANAYARIGYTPQVDIFARGDEGTVKAAYEEKIDSKLAKGYSVSEAKANESDFSFKIGDKVRVQGTDKVGIISGTEEDGGPIGNVYLIELGNGKRDWFHEVKLELAEAKVSEGVLAKYVKMAHKYWEGIPNVVPDPDDIWNAALDAWSEETGQPIDADIEKQMAKEIGIEECSLLKRKMKEERYPEAQESKVAEALPGQSSTLNVLARGITDQQVATNLANSKKGKVVPDLDDAKKFMVISVEERTLDNYKVCKCGWEGDAQVDTCPKCKQKLDPNYQGESHDAKIKESKYNLVGVDGNAFSVMGYVKTAMKKEEKSKEEIDAYLEDAMSDDYNHLLAISSVIIAKLNDKKVSESPESEVTALTAQEIADKLGISLEAAIAIHKASKGIVKSGVTSYSPKNATILGTYDSASSPGKKYYIVKGKDGVVYCTCPAWRYHKTCRHLEDFKEKNPSMAESKVEYKVEETAEEKVFEEKAILVEFFVAQGKKLSEKQKAFVEAFIKG